jgi:FKBP-type peptidyl-prolyl cis-trans isomerase
MKLDFKVLDVMPEADYDKLMSEKANEQLGKEQKVIEDYLAKNNLKGERTTSGLYVIIEDPGMGKQPQKGNTVKVNYTGTLLDGTKFDSSLDPGREPSNFRLEHNR